MPKFLIIALHRCLKLNGLWWHRRSAVSYLGIWIIYRDLYESIHQSTYLTVPATHLGRIMLATLLYSKVTSATKCRTNVRDKCWWHVRNKCRLQVCDNLDPMFATNIGCTFATNISPRSATNVNLLFTTNVGDRSATNIGLKSATNVDLMFARNVGGTTAININAYLQQMLTAGLRQMSMASLAVYFKQKTESWW